MAPDADPPPSCAGGAEWVGKNPIDPWLLLVKPAKDDPELYITCRATGRAVDTYVALLHRCSVA